jgi:hypothetical protein
MSSRKLLALKFIKEYFAEFGYSPSFGELAAELGVSKKRAHDLVHQLAQQHMIEHETGKTRGIRLVERGEELSEADVLLRLQAMGWTIGRGDYVVFPPDNFVGAAIAGPLTEKGLHTLPVLDHNPARAMGAGKSGETGEGRKRTRASTHARGAQIS